ncbi:MAG: pseudouridine-5'-phosphate glycosidase [Chloroflexota bacterium]|nr:pseudouridine-5'-phosphate glycosidase [Chloroflexota bacterium]
MQQPLTINAEIKSALAAGRAVVALESTLITHGLPYPRNVETALAMEAAVREAGAVPATIAILKGDITVGITSCDIEALAQMPPGSVRKCSRRDLAIAAALQQDGATTVASTMIVAKIAGIKVFATGGIGGVHRGQPQDVSADLIELGRSPVAVVSSGAKSILDLPLTLEVLESQGVPILGFRTDVLPAFYAARTELPIDQRVESAAEAAAIIQAADTLGAQHGILIAVPVPQGRELNAELAEAAIAQATIEAEEAGVGGKDITPFLLNRVSELTKGASMAANIALLVNNARIAGQIALELSRI